MSAILYLPQCVNSVNPEQNFTTRYMLYNDSIGWQCLNFENFYTDISWKGYN